MDWGGGRTIEYRSDEESCEVGLLSEVQPVRDLWSIRVAGPRRSPKASHCSGGVRPTGGVRRYEGGSEGEGSGVKGKTSDPGGGKDYNL